MQPRVSLLLLAVFAVLGVALASVSLSAAAADAAQEGLLQGKANSKPNPDAKDGGASAGDALFAANGRKSNVIAMGRPSTKSTSARRRSLSDDDSDDTLTGTVADTNNPYRCKCICPNNVTIAEVASETDWSVREAKQASASYRSTCCVYIGSETVGGGRTENRESVARGENSN